MLLGDRRRWGRVQVRGDDDAVLLTVHRERRTTLLARGGSGVVDLVDAWCAAHGDHVRSVGWMTVPRATHVPPGTLAALALEPFSTWDWLMTRTPPPAVDGTEVVLLGPQDAPAVQSCLDVANPGTSARPGAAGDVGWWGVRDRAEPGRLVAVVSATERGGDPHRYDRSWHLRGLAVRPEHRGRGLGRAVAAGATRAAFAGGADWVSLGMYADNLPARRVYAGLGFTVEAEQRSYGPAGTTSPPA